MNMPIDFVVLWVDGNDSAWLKKKNSYLDKHNSSVDSSDSRYRDWNIFKYWFRSIEQNAPWVNKIFLITDHQIPDFLNLNHEKLRIVFHDDYIPNEFLPTFSANPIELNLHRIPSLSEHFVFFNDDFYLNRPVSPDMFFRNGKPCYEFIERPIVPVAPVSMIQHICFNDMGVVNRHFKRKNILNKPGLYLNYHYGKHGIKNLCMLPWREFQHFQDDHMPCPFLKSTFEDVWRAEPFVLEKTSGHKFRSYEDVNQYVFRYWDLARGNFSPNHFEGGYYSINRDNINDCVSDIVNMTHCMICINDEVSDNEFLDFSSKIQKAFSERYSEKSSFEN